MFKIVSQQLHQPENLPDEINKSALMLTSIAQAIRDAAQSGAYNEVQKTLERAVRELQYLDRMIDESYGGLGTSGNPLHERATPETNYLLNPEFHLPSSTP